MLHIQGIVASKLVVDGVVELWQEACIHLFAVVFQHHSQHLLFGGSVPHIAVVFKLHILFFLLVLGPFHLHAVVHLECSCGQFVGSAAKGFSEVGQCADVFKSLVVQVFHQVQVQLAFQVAGRVLILSDALFKGLFLSYQVHAVYALVHAQ